MVLFLALAIFLGGFGLFAVGDSLEESAPPPLTTTPTAPKPAQIGRATLTIKRTMPFVIVAGSGFKPNEMVRLSGPKTVRVRTTARGNFSVRLGSADPCGDLTIVAVGSQGSRASIQFSQFQCAVP
jgi:hypothetical protein